MAKLGPGRAKRTWGGVRQHGGVLRDHRGRNLTRSATGYGSFTAYMNLLCNDNGDEAAALLEQIDSAVERAEDIKRLNEATTWKKCYSKVDAKFLPGCRVDIKMVAGGPDEEDCADGN